LSYKPEEVREAFEEKLAQWAKDGAPPVPDGEINN
jgi:hypothetical protein